MYVAHILIEITSHSIYLSQIQKTPHIFQSLPIALCYLFLLFKIYCVLCPAFSPCIISLSPFLSFCLVISLINHLILISTVFISLVISLINYLILISTVFISLVINFMNYLCFLFNLISFCIYQSTLHAFVFFNFFLLIILKLSALSFLSAVVSYISMIF